MSQSSTAVLPMEPDPNVGDIEGLSQHWERTLKADVRRGIKVPRTVRTYMVSVRQLIAYLAENDLPTDVADIKREHVREFIDHLSATWAPATANLRYTALKIFFAWLEDEEVIDDNPLRKVKPPSLGESKMPLVLSSEQIKAMFDATSGKSFTEVRDHAILRLFDSTGVRVDELTQIQHYDDPSELKYVDPETTPFLDLFENTVHVLGKGQGKGKRPRTTGFDDETAEALSRYVRLRAKLLRELKVEDHKRLWISTRTGRPLGTGGVTLVVKNAARQARVGDVHPHLFRHTWASRMKRFIDQGKIGEESVLVLGGWASPNVFRKTYGRAAKVERALDAYRNLNLGAL